MNNIFRFENTEILYFLAVIPLLLLLFWYAQRAKRKAFNRLGDFQVLLDLMPDFSENRPKVKFAFVLFALFLLVLALAQPQFGSKLKEVKRQGIEIMIALDVSNSMLSEDIKPNRLSASKRAISKLVDKLKNDKIGLIVFAGDAYVQVPITTDYRATKMFLKTLTTNIVPKQGTNIASAIELASKSFSSQEDRTKAIIIITDGEDHEQNAIEAAQQAKEQGIKIYTIGMGSPKPQPIPIAEGSSEFKKDDNGSIVMSKLNEQILKQIALESNGVYVRANNSTTGLDLIYEEIENLEKTEIESSIFEDYEERFQYLLGIVLFILVFDFFVLERKNKLTKNINLFE
jgi:Ca-activated chloride channel family protein